VGNLPIGERPVASLTRLNPAEDKSLGECAACPRQPRIEQGDRADPPAFGTATSCLYL
jgi:hypothetical protein